MSPVEKQRLIEGVIESLVFATPIVIGMLKKHRSGVKEVKKNTDDKIDAVEERFGIRMDGVEERLSTLTMTVAAKEKDHSKQDARVEALIQKFSEAGVLHAQRMAEQREAAKQQQKTALLQIETEKHYRELLDQTKLILTAVAKKKEA